MQHVTKWAEPITMGKAVPEIMRRAFFQLRNGRPGPVMIEVPLDVMNEDVPDNWVYEPAFSAKSALIRPTLPPQPRSWPRPSVQ